MRIEILLFVAGGVMELEIPPPQKICLKTKIEK
jgi:hypothetical protein